MLSYAIFSKSMCCLWVAFLFHSEFVFAGSGSNCLSQKFLSAAGIRLRESPKSDAKVVSQLRFNTQVCLKTGESDWVNVETLTEPKVSGWIQGRFFADQAMSPNDPLEEATKAEAHGDMSMAIIWTERAVDAWESSETLDLFSKN